MSGGVKLWHAVSVRRNAYTSRGPAGAACIRGRTPQWASVEDVRIKNVPPSCMSVLATADNNGRT